MNEHNEHNENVDFDADEAVETIVALQDEVDELRSQLDDAHDRIAELESAPSEAPAPAGTAELQGLARTYRAALRNGHPDAAKHLETLLSALGA